MRPPSDHHRERKRFIADLESAHEQICRLVEASEEDSEFIVEACRGYADLAEAFGLMATAKAYGELGRRHRPRPKSSNLAPTHQRK